MTWNVTHRHQPDLAGATTTCRRSAARPRSRRRSPKAREIGYEGFELGNKFPREPAALARSLAEHGLALRVGLVLRPARASARSRTRSRAVGPHLRMLAENGAKVDGLRRSAPTRIQGAAARRWTSGRASATTAQWHAYADTAHALRRAPAGATACALAYHHHMGAYVESPDDVDELMARDRPDEVGLLFDTGHMTFAAAATPSRCSRKHVARVVPRALQGRAAGGDRAGAQRRLELPRRRCSTAPSPCRATASSTYAAVLRHPARRRLRGLAGRRGRAGSGRWRRATRTRRRASARCAASSTADRAEAPTWSASARQGAPRDGREIVDGHAASAPAGATSASRRCGWRAGEPMSRAAGEREVCVVVLRRHGRRRRRSGQTLCATSATRDSVFDDVAPAAVYVPRGAAVDVDGAHATPRSRSCTAPAPAAQARPAR